MKDPIQQDLLVAIESARSRPKPRPRKQFLSDEQRALCRRIAWLYGQGREPPPDDDHGLEETEVVPAHRSEADGKDQ